MCESEASFGMGNESIVWRLNRVLLGFNFTISLHVSLCEWRKVEGSFPFYFLLKFVYLRRVAFKKQCVAVS